MSVIDTLFMRAARREPVEHTPVWFMRQAGRILPEYRAVREHHTLVEICRQPELCAEVTLQPIHRLGVDAAILFSDIMTPLLGVGIDLQIVDGVGPVIAQPISAASDLERLRPLEPEQDLPYVLESIRILVERLRGERALIGFAGAPFTLAAYLVEGRPSRDFVKVKSMMFGAPQLWHALMDRLTKITIRYLMAQARAGADALQLFDSWVGALAPRDYATFVQPYAQRIFAALAPLGVPCIHFGTGTATLLPLMANDGAPIIGIDWHTPIDEAWCVVGHDKGVQGNLDPAVLFAPDAYVRERVADVLRRTASRRGHIFNLGHGLHPQTPVATVQRAVEYVHELSARIPELAEATA